MRKMFLPMQRGVRRLMLWRVRHISDSAFVMMLSVVVGLLSGTAAVLLKRVVHLLSHGLLHFSVPTSVGGNALMLIYPAIGLILTVLYVRCILRKDIGHGLPSVLYALSRGKSRLPASNTFSSLIASTLTVAFGGSVGLEAPIASTGSALGSNIGRALHLHEQGVRLLLGCGAAGAIAGIFKAPLAGVLFVVEVFLFDLTMTSTVPLLLSALSAWSVAYFFMGADLQFAFTVEQVYDLSQLPYYAFLGVFCAAASLYFLRTTDRIEQLMKRIGKPWKRLAVGSLVLGLTIFLFPPLYGEGYDFLSQLLSGHLEVIFNGSIYSSLSDRAWSVPVLLVLIILFKVIATATTIGSGGVGGTFGPSLIVGGLCGCCVASLIDLCGLPSQSLTNFALVGMAAVMSGVMHAPLMATFLIAEITGGYELMIPLLITVVITYICVTPFEKHSIYARALAKRGDLVTHNKDGSALRMMDISKLIETNFVIVRYGDTLGTLVEAIQNSRRNIFPVLTEDDKFIGVVVLDDVRHIIFRPDLYSAYRVEQLMHPLSEGDVVRLGEEPSAIVNKFKVGDRYNLIVIDNKDNYLGFLSRANMFSAYRRYISESSEE